MFFRQKPSGRYRYIQIVENHREGGPDPRPIDPAYRTLEDDLDALTEWFPAAKQQITEMFDRYLTL